MDLLWFEGRRGWCIDVDSMQFGEFSVQWLWGGTEGLHDGEIWGWRNANEHGCGAWWVVRHEELFGGWRSSRGRWVRWWGECFWEGRWWEEGWWNLSPFEEEGGWVWRYTNGYY